MEVGIARLRDLPLLLISLGAIAKRPRREDRACWQRHSCRFYLCPLGKEANVDAKNHF